MPMVSKPSQYTSTRGPRRGKWALNTIINDDGTINDNAWVKICINEIERKSSQRT